MASVTTTQTNSTAAKRGIYWPRMIERTLIYLALVACVVLVGAPFVYMITGSFRYNAEIFSYPLTFLPKEPTLENYQRLLNGSEIPYVRQFANSLFVAVSQTLLTLLVASMVGWGFAKYEFKGKRVLMLLLLVTLTIRLMRRRSLMGFSSFRTRRRWRSFLGATESCGPRITRF